MSADAFRLWIVCFFVGCVVCAFLTAVVLYIRDWWQDHSIRKFRDGEL